MATALCPACRTIRNMKVAFTKRTVKAPDGSVKTLQTVSFHCESCGQFVRSEEAELALPAKG